MADIDKLILQLVNFQTRAAARRELAALGKEAVPALMKALKNPNEGIRWSAAKTLGEIGDAAATDALVESLADANLTSTAAESLERITGKKLGVDPQAWRHWRQTGEETHTASATPSFAAGAIEEIVSAVTLSDDDVVSRLVTGMASVASQRRNGAWELCVQLEQGRKQHLALTFDSKDAEGKRLVCVYTECGPAHVSKYDTVFRYNLMLPYGHVAVRDIDGQPTFVMMFTTPRETLDIAVLRRALLAIAKQADALEYELTRKDII
jgi:hypothetical protein